MTQDDFAEAVDLSRKTIYAIENSREDHPVFENEHAVVRRMAKVLRVSVSTLSIRLGWLPAEEARAKGDLLIRGRRVDLSEADLDVVASVAERLEKKG